MGIQPPDGDGQNSNSVHWFHPLCRAEAEILFGPYSVFKHELFHSASSALLLGLYWLLGLETYRCFMLAWHLHFLVGSVPHIIAPVLFLIIL